MRRKILILFVGAWGCSFDAGGMNDAGGTGSTDGTGASDGTDAGSDSGTSAGVTGSATSVGTSAGTSSSTAGTETDGASATAGETAGSTTTTNSGPSTDSTSTMGDGSSTSSSTTDGSSSTGGAMCEPPPELSELYWAKDAVLNGMQLAPSQSLPEVQMQDVQIAYSEIAGQGTITFAVEVPCAGDYAIWGLVWDRYEGTQNPSNADSFYWNVDAGNESTWAYGCDTYNLGDGSWSWQRLGTYDGMCPNQVVTVPLAPGVHDVTFRNRENGDFQQENNVAAIAAIVVANDPMHDPNTEYEP